MQSLGNVAIAPRIENALLSYGRYIGMQVNFGRLSVFYPYLGRASAWEVLAVLVLLAGVTAFAWRQRARRPWLLVGWLWYLVTLLPMAGIVQVGEQAYADRFTYLPAVGLLIMAVFSGAEAWQRSIAARKLLAGAATFAIVILGGFAIKQVNYWQNSISLFERGIAVTTANYLLCGNLAGVYLRLGRADLAEAYFRESARINPAHANARLGLGMLYLMERRPAEAVPELEAAVALKPEDPMAHDLYGASLGMSGRLSEAITEFSDAVRLDPTDARARQNLAMALAEQTRRSAATRPPASGP